MSRDIYFFGEIKSFFALLKIIKKEKPDVLHLNSSKMGLVGGLCGRLCGVPKIIFTAHGLASNEDRSVLSRKFFLFLHWLTILLSDTHNRRFGENKKRFGPGCRLSAEKFLSFTTASEK